MLFLKQTWARVKTLIRYSQREVGYCCFCQIPCGISEVRTVSGDNKPTSYNCVDCTDARR